MAWNALCKSALLSAKKGCVDNLRLLHLITFQASAVRVTRDIEEGKATVILSRLLRRNIVPVVHFYLLFFVCLLLFKPTALQAEARNGGGTCFRAYVSSGMKQRREPMSASVFQGALYEFAQAKPAPAP